MSGECEVCGEHTLECKCKPMKETFEIFPHGVLVPFKSKALKKAHEDFDSLYYDLLSEKLDQEDIRQRLESTATLLHILYEETFVQDKIIND